MLWSLVMPPRPTFRRLRMRPARRHERRPSPAPFAVIAIASLVVSCNEAATAPDDSPGPPAVLQELTGNRQQATVGTSLGQPFVVEVLDARGRAVGGTTVAFAVASGGGSVSPTSAVTNEDGEARTTLTLGTFAGEQTVTATVTGLPAVTFTATALAGAPVLLSLESGDAQTGTVAAPLAAPIIVRVTDASGNGVPGVRLTPVTATWSGTLLLAQALTDAQGRASGTWHLGTAAGPQEASISAQGISGPGFVPLTATAVAGPGDSLTILNGNGQSGDVSSTLPVGLRVRVADRYGNPVGGASVSYAVEQGGGTLSASTALTDGAGVAESMWTLGADAGPQLASATLARSAGAVVRQFTATALAPSPAALWTIGHQVVDAEFSVSANRIITVSTNPNRLYVLDPEGRTTASVDLPLAPLSVAVNPSGTRAAVSFDGYATLVDLATPAVVRTLAVASVGGDIALTDRNTAFVFPRSDQWVSIFCVNFDSGLVGPHSGWGPYANARVRLHPGGDYLYSASNGLSPSDIEKYDVRGDTARAMYDSPYHGDYAFNGDLWLADDGTRIFMRSGNVFLSTASQSSDMTYAGALSGVATVNAVLHRSSAPRIYVLGSATSASPWGPERVPVTDVRSYEPQFLGYQGSARLPKITSPAGLSYQTEGYFLFGSADATRLYVLVRAPASSGAILWGVAAFDAADVP